MQATQYIDIEGSGGSGELLLFPIIPAVSFNYLLSHFKYKNDADTVMSIKIYDSDDAEVVAYSTDFTLTASGSYINSGVKSIGVSALSSGFYDVKITFDNGIDIKNWVTILSDTEVL